MLPSSSRRLDRAPDRALLVGADSVSLARRFLHDRRWYWPAHWLQARCTFCRRSRCLNRRLRARSAARVGCVLPVVYGLMIWTGGHVIVAVENLAHSYGAPRTGGRELRR